MRLGLDLGMACGWALFTDAGLWLASGSWHLGQDPTRTRWQELELRVLSRVGAHGVRRLAYEHVRRHAATTAAHVFGGWLAALENVAKRCAVRLVALRTQDLHAAANVKGATKVDFPNDKLRREENKHRMVMAARGRGWNVGDDNEAEACFCVVADLAKGAAA